MVYDLPLVVVSQFRNYLFHSKISCEAFQVFQVRDILCQISLWRKQSFHDWMKVSVAVSSRLWLRSKHLLKRVIVLVLLLSGLFLFLLHLLQVTCCECCRLSWLTRTLTIPLCRPKLGCPFTCLLRILNVNLLT